MVASERIAEIAAHLRNEGIAAIADNLANAHKGVFGGTELAMKWRFHLANALNEERLSPETRREVEQVWQELEAALS